MSKFTKRPVPRFDRRAVLARFPQGSWMRRYRRIRQASRRRATRRFMPSLGCNDPRLAKGATYNFENWLAFGRDDRCALMTMAACCLVNEKAFYMDTTAKIRLLIYRTAQQHPEWTVKLAVFLREQLHLRSISQLILAYASTVEAAQPYIAKAFSRVAVRPDDMIEIAALLKDPAHQISNSMPASIRKSINKKLNLLSEFHAVKYRKANQFGLKHLIRICHPKPSSDRQSFLFRYLGNKGAWQKLPDEKRESFKIISAWEAIERKKKPGKALLDRCACAGLPWEMLLPRFDPSEKTWTALVPHMPIMALVRNLRNLHESGSLKNKEVRKQVHARLTDPEVISRSRQFPFRWLAAYRMLEYADKEVACWLEKAMALSVGNLPHIPGVTAIACDLSASMRFNRISQRSLISPMDISTLLAAVADRICEKSHIFGFGTDVAQLDFIKPGRILANAKLISKINVGQATYAYKVLENMTDQGMYVDRVLFFTDMQIYGKDPEWYVGQDLTGLLRQYRETINPRLKTYIFNLQPYSHFMTPADEEGVTYFSGWNADLLRFVAQDTETEEDPMIRRVEELEL